MISVPVENILETLQSSTISSVPVGILGETPRVALLIRKLRQLHRTTFLCRGHSLAKLAIILSKAQKHRVGEVVDQLRIQLGPKLMIEQRLYGVAVMVLGLFILILREDTVQVEGLEVLSNQSLGGFFAVPLGR